MRLTAMRGGGVESRPNPQRKYLMEEADGVWVAHRQQLGDSLVMQCTDVELGIVVRVYGSITSMMTGGAPLPCSPRFQHNLTPHWHLCKEYFASQVRPKWR